MAKTGTTSEIYVPDHSIFGLTDDAFAVIVAKQKIYKINEVPESVEAHLKLVGFKAK